MQCADYSFSTVSRFNFISNTYFFNATIVTGINAINATPRY